MAASYDPNLATDKDFVRFLIRDTDVASPMLSDEEIIAVLAEEEAVGASLKYAAAATALSSLHTAWMSRGRGIVSKKVDTLSLVYGTAGINVDVAMVDRIKELRIMAARRASKRPRPLRML